MFNFKYSSGRFAANASSDSKNIQIIGPDDFELSMGIDHDDVDHDVVEAQVAYLCRILDKNWFPV